MCILIAIATAIATAIASIHRPVRSGTRGGGYGYLDIDEVLESYGSLGV